MKYNLSAIMKRAWELVKKMGLTISEGLKNAWKEAKAMAEKKEFNGFVKLVIAGREHCSDDDASKFLTFKKWEKNDVTRIYVNDYKRRTIGFIENGEFTLKDRQGLFRSEADVTIERFMDEYAF